MGCRRIEKAVQYSEAVERCGEGIRQANPKAGQGIFIEYEGKLGQGVEKSKTAADEGGDHQFRKVYSPDPGSRKVRRGLRRSNNAV
ncbi:MAG: hypothetical protein U0411_03210 [Thermodesulfovibrionales bacterium]